MALVLSERDYKLLTLFTKVIGIFLWAAGSITLVDRRRVGLGLFLILLGTVVTLAPVPMSVVRPKNLDGPEEPRDGELAVNE